MSEDIFPRVELGREPQDTIDSQMEPLGCMTLDLPNGRHHLCERSGLITGVMEPKGRAPVVVLTLYGSDADLQKAAYHQMTPSDARRIAASLLNLADEIEPTVKH